MRGTSLSVFPFMVMLDAMLEVHRVKGKRIPKELRCLGGPSGGGASVSHSASPTGQRMAGKDNRQSSVPPSSLAPCHPLVPLTEFFLPISPSRTRVPRNLPHYHLGLPTPPQGPIKELVGVVTSALARLAQDERREGEILSEARVSPSPVHWSPCSPPARMFWPQTRLLALGLYQSTFQGFGFPPAPSAGASPPSSWHLMLPVSCVICHWLLCWSPVSHHHLWVESHEKDPDLTISFARYGILGKSASNPSTSKWDDDTNPYRIVTKAEHIRCLNVVF